MTNPQTDVAGLVEELRSPKQLGPVDPKANYRTKPVAILEAMADAFTSLTSEVERLKGERDEAVKYALDAMEFSALLQADEGEAG